MRDIFPRPARSGDIQKIDEWIRTTPQNLFDPDILQYGNKLQFYCAHNGEPILFMPVQNVLVLESLAIKPGATVSEIAGSIAVLIKHLVCKAEELAYHELFFICKDKDVSAYATRHGFETVMYDNERGVTLFRWKICKEPSSTK